MNHGEIYKYFELYFPDFSGDKVDVWFQNGKTAFVFGRKTVRNLYLLITVKTTGNLKLLKALWPA